MTYTYSPDDIVLQVLKEENEKYAIDLRERILNFAVQLFKLIASLPKDKEFDVIRIQISRSGTSIGANYEEAQSSTYREFSHKTRIALREANETKYWLRVLEKLAIGDTELLKSLLNEINEISKILGSIVSKIDKKIKNQNL